MVRRLTSALAVVVLVLGIGIMGAAPAAAAGHSGICEATGYSHCFRQNGGATDEWPRDKRGHTYWYLSAAPELLALAGQRLEQHLEVPS